MKDNKPNEPVIGQELADFLYEIISEQYQLDNN